MITSAQAIQYLDQALGLSVPDFVVNAAIERVEAVEPAMVAAGYSEAVQTLVQCMAVAVIAAGGDPRRIQSQGAASGASRSFKYSAGDLSALRRSLAALDVSKTVADVIGPDPSAPAMFMVV